jgi:hypothetical protein
MLDIPTGKTRCRTLGSGMDISCQHRWSRQVTLPSTWSSVSVSAKGLSCGPVLKMASIVRRSATVALPAKPLIRNRSTGRVSLLTVQAYRPLKRGPLKGGSILYGLNLWDQYRARPRSHSVPIVHEWLVYRRGALGSAAGWFWQVPPVLRDREC